MAKDPSKTEKATPRRRQKAREEGQVPRSMDIPIAVSLLTVFLMMFFYIPYAYSNLYRYFRYTFADVFYKIPEINTVFIYDTVKIFIILIAPVFLLLIIAGVASNVAQFGFLLTLKPLVPKLNRLNVISGLGRLVSLKTGFELVRNLLKLSFASAVAFFLVKNMISQTFSMSFIPLGDEVHFLFKYMFVLLLSFTLISVPIAVIDFLYRRWEYEENIKMSKEEIKEERKLYEGNPQIKAAIRKKQRELAMMRMMAEVPKADVVITNPEHYAVALQYKRGEMAAPKVIAKGKNNIAEKIKEIAKENNIPIVEDPPLARSLYSSCEVGDFIPENLYVAVAKILAKIFKKRGGF